MPTIPRREIEAHFELMRQGSVMAKDRSVPEWRSKLSPTIQTALNAVDAAIESLAPNPLDAVGGKGAAWGMIGPKAKQVLMDAIPWAPAMMKRVAENPRRVSVFTKPELSRGSLGRYQHLPSGEGRVLISRNQPYEEQIITAIHELQHFLNAPRTLSTSREHAIETAQQIAELLPLNVPKMRIHEYIANAKSAIQHVERLPANLRPEAKGFARGGTAEAQQAYTESLSYLAETLVSPEGRDRKDLKLIARALGIGLD